MSDTPRTDAENTYVVHGITHVSVHHARTLERELSLANAKIKELERENKRLEELWIECMEM